MGVYIDNRYAWGVVISYQLLDIDAYKYFN